MIYCMDSTGREQFNICQENQEFVGEKRDTDFNLFHVYKCLVCGREWQEEFKYFRTVDMNGDELE